MKNFFIKIRTIVGLLLCFSQIYGANPLDLLLKKYKPGKIFVVGSFLEIPEPTKSYFFGSAIYLDSQEHPDLIYLDLFPSFEYLQQSYARVRGWGILCGSQLNEAVKQFALQEGIELRKIGSGWYYKEKGETPYPIGFSIPECKIVREIPPKDQDFARTVPRDVTPYLFEEEADYYNDYQRSYFAVTKRKGGWDCLRHYEILANGCIPYFLDLASCDPKTLYFFPKELVQEAMALPGVSYLEIDHTQFPEERYREILNQLLVHTRKYLTTRETALYVLNALHYSGQGSVLFLSGEEEIDYLQYLMGIGLKECLRERLVDVVKLAPIYQSYSGDIHKLYGKGMTYTKIVEDIPTDRENIEERIRNREFELIIYSSVHRSLPFYDVVLQTYSAEKIAYLCGGDWHSCGYAHLKNFFIRENDAALPLLKSFPHH
jgi:hypothetical protein